MAYTEREVDAARHTAAAQEAFAQHQEAERALSTFSYDYVWAPGGDAEHLHKMAKGEVLNDVGPRDAHLEALVQTYETRRQQARDTLARWAQERDRMQRLNRAHQVGRLLMTPVKVLDVLWLRGSMQYYTVIGTYAMYAYEAAAGVVFDEPTMATNDVDLFYSADKR